MDFVLDAGMAYRGKLGVVRPSFTGRNINPADAHFQLLACKNNVHVNMSIVENQTYEFKATELGMRILHFELPPEFKPEYAYIKASGTGIEHVGLSDRICISNKGVVSRN